ncbi:hypothetical protein ACFOEX_00490, partial [Camelimonas abortus]
PLFRGQTINRTRDFSRNPTAAHEMFHLFQYGYGMFKTGWLLEGMARWSERFFTSRTPPPPAPGRCEDVTGRAYAAASWWAARWPLAAAAPSVRPLAAARYAGGAPVIPRLAGVAGGQVRADLERLARLSVQVSRRLGLPADAWPEQLQRASRHDRELCAALEQNRPSGAR